MPAKTFDAFLHARSIAVFGASERNSSVGSVVFSNLIKGGFEGNLVGINPKYKEVMGKSCYPDIGSVPEAVDLALIATPAKFVPGIIRECGKKGIRNAVILSAGFREIGGEGVKLEADLVAAARQHSIRFIGPNCVGLSRAPNKMNGTFLGTEPPSGSLGIVSQSGALCSAIADWAAPHHLGFSAMFSLGNSTDVDFGEVLDILANDPETKAILLYVEGIRNARSFISALKMAARAKPVIVLKSGRHTAGSKAASTHTGALIGSDGVFNAALERAGAVRVETFGKLFAAAEILATGTRASGKRLAIITNGGGAGVLAADRVEDLHIDLPAPSEKTVEELNKILPPFWSHANPIDVLGDAGPDAYAAAVTQAVADPNYDGVLVMLTPQAMTDSLGIAKAIHKAVPKNNRKPVLACWMGDTTVAEARNYLFKSGIPNFETPEKAVEAFFFLARHHPNQSMAREVPGPVSDPTTPDVEGVRMIIETALEDGRDMLSDTESKAVLKAFHIPTNTTFEVYSAAQAVVAAETLGFPVAMKVLSPQISHKSDVGGVKINIMTAPDVHEAWREIMNAASAARPDANILGVTVESMARVPAARELLIGSSRDPVFGPTLVFGAGGTMVEVLQDSAIALPPLNGILAHRQINRTRVARLLESVRDQPAVNRQAIVDVMLRVSDLVCEFPEISELDINPLFAGPDGALAVDARIKISRPPATLERYGHLAIAAYPRHFERTLHLADGTEMFIRPIRPEDAEGEQSFVRSLSAEARRMRFMGAISELTPEMLARFTQIDYDREMALLSTIEEKGKQVQQGVARYTINPDGESCEFAIVVADNVQHRGIGTRLMQTLMDAAREHRLTKMEGKVLAENTKMLQLMTELGFEQRTDPEDRSVILVERMV